MTNQTRITAPGIRLRGLEVRAAGARLMGPIDLALGAGELVALIGESGSGKTLLGRAMAGLALPGCVVAGEVALAGQRLRAGAGGAAWRKLWGRQIAHLRHDPREVLDPRRPVAQHLAAVLAAHAAPGAQAGAARVTAALERAGLSAALGAALPGALSGGQCQRLALEMVLATPASVLILDEPTSALDGPAVAGVLTRLRARADAGAAVLMMTHDLAQAARADRILVLHAGQLVEDGPAGRVLAGAGHPCTRALLAANPACAASLAALRPITAPPPDPMAPDLPACRFAPRCAWAQPRCLREVPVMRDGVACHGTGGAP